nr:uncharacterized protein LOC103346828 [Oryctolagus cuniculus]XP_051693276.1 uncharacterized protein LOC103346828 [Oryctolagus cuniculus]XP_051693277.1 uncharacterized protein LOC103346828 [Oryctolagus cuniculus]XP_051693278.1 uncharacterized protein LOC103346828 [Oryctolagus cuniculus]XP_051693279.1 uncharacterized protein LOC103346828 [Oryctolagus cuniculus]
METYLCHRSRNEVRAGWLQVAPRTVPLDRPGPRPGLQCQPMWALEDRQAGGSSRSGSHHESVAAPGWSTSPIPAGHGAPSTGCPLPWALPLCPSFRGSRLHAGGTEEGGEGPTGGSQGPSVATRAQASLRVRIALYWGRGLPTWLCALVLWGLGHVRDSSLWVMRCPWQGPGLPCPWGTAPCLLLPMPTPCTGSLPGQAALPRPPGAPRGEGSCAELLLVWGLQLAHKASIPSISSAGSGPWLAPLGGSLGERPLGPMPFSIQGYCSCPATITVGLQVPRAVPWTSRVPVHFRQHPSLSWPPGPAALIRWRSILSWPGDEMARGSLNLLSLGGSARLLAVRARSSHGLCLSCTVALPSLACPGSAHRRAPLSSALLCGSLPQWI